MSFKKRFAREFQNKIQGKIFIIDNDKWIIEEVISYGYKCRARKLNDNTIKVFSSDDIISKLT